MLPSTDLSDGGTPLVNLLLFLSHSLHVSNHVVLLCFHSSAVDLTTAILNNEFPYMHAKWLIVNNCSAPDSQHIFTELGKIPFIISVVDSNGAETVKQIDAMLDARNEIAHATHVVVLNEPNASEALSEEFFVTFAKKFLLLHIVAWRTGVVRMLTKRTWFEADNFVRSGNISDDELVRWTFDESDLPYHRINYVLLCVPPFLIKTKGMLNGKNVTSVGGMEVETISLVADQLHVTPQFFSVDFTTSTSSEQCYDCTIRDEYYEHEYAVRDIRLPALPIKEFGKSSGGIAFREFHDSYVHNSVILVSPHFSVEHLAYFREQLYPHAFDGFAVVVPTEYRSASIVLQSMVNSALFRIWTISIVVFTFMRKVCQRIGTSSNTSSATMGTVFFATIGITFGTTSQKAQNRPEAILLLFASVFALLAGILCSGMLFQQFATSSKTPTIKTVEQLLERPDLEIVLPVWMNGSHEYWTKRHGGKVSVFHDPIMMARIWNLDTSAAYIFSESAVQIILQKEHISSRFHRLDELFGSKPLRYMVSPWSIKPVMDVFVQRTIEHGLWTFFAQRTDQIMHQSIAAPSALASSSKNHNSQDGKSAASGAFDSITMHELAFMFGIYVAGNFLAVCTFGVELAWRRFGRERFRKLTRTSRFVRFAVLNRPPQNEYSAEQQDFDVARKW